MSTVPSLVLYEHATGYGLFRVKEFEEVSALEAEVEASANDVSAFNSVVRYPRSLIYQFLTTSTRFLFAIFPILLARISLYT